MRRRKWEINLYDGRANSQIKHTIYPTLHDTHECDFVWVGRCRCKVNMPSDRCCLVGIKLDFKEYGGTKSGNLPIPYAVQNSVVCLHSGTMLAGGSCAKFDDRTSHFYFNGTRLMVLSTLMVSVAGS
jgi:hypothetical protein